MECNNLFQKVGDILTYPMKVPEGERQDSAIKRNQEALSTELKLWEGYLKVTLQQTDCLERCADVGKKILSMDVCCTWTIKILPYIPSISIELWLESSITTVPFFGQWLVTRKCHRGPIMFQIVVPKCAPT